jgi:hypothetical protein
MCAAPEWADDWPIAAIERIEERCEQLDAAEHRIKELESILVAVRDAMRKEPAVQGDQYKDLGVRVNQVLQGR